MFPFRGLYNVVDILVKQLKMMIDIYACSSERTLTLRIWEWRRASSRASSPRRAKNQNVKKKDKGLRAGFCGAILLGKILISAFSCKKRHKNSFDYTEAFSKIL